MRALRERIALLLAPWLWPQQEWRYGLRGMWVPRLPDHPDARPDDDLTMDGAIWRSW